MNGSAKNSPMSGAARPDAPRHALQIATDLTPQFIHIVFADDREIEIIDLLHRENHPSVETTNRMQSASATLESALDSSKHIIAQLLCPVQRIADASVPAIDIVHQSGFLGVMKMKTEQSVSGIPTWSSLRFAGH